MTTINAAFRLRATSKKVYDAQEQINLSTKYLTKLKNNNESYALKVKEAIKESIKYFEKVILDQDTENERKVAYKLADAAMRSASSPDLYDSDKKHTPTEADKAKHLAFEAAYMTKKYLS